MSDYKTDSSLAVQNEVECYGVMRDAVRDYVTSDNADLPTTPEALDSAAQAAQILENRGITPRRAAAIMRLALYDAWLEKTPFDQAAADRYGRSQLDVQSASSEPDHPLGVYHRAEVAGRDLWEQITFEFDHLSAKQTAFDQTSKLPNWLNKNTRVTVGVVAAGAIAALLVARRQHAR